MLEIIAILASLSFSTASVGEITINGNDKETRIERKVERAYNKLVKAEARMQVAGNRTVTQGDVARKQRKLTLKLAKYQYQLQKMHLKSDVKNFTTVPTQYPTTVPNN